MRRIEESLGLAGATGPAGEKTVGEEERVEAAKVKKSRGL
jgi:hypothetical protein